MIFKICLHTQTERHKQFGAASPLLMHKQYSAALPQANGQQASFVRRNGTLPSLREEEPFCIAVRPKKPLILIYVLPLTSYLSLKIPVS